MEWLVILHIQLVPRDCNRYPSWEQREIQETKYKWRKVIKRVYLDKGVDDFLAIPKKTNFSNHNNTTEQLALTFQKCFCNQMYLFV